MRSTGRARPALQAAGTILLTLAAVACATPVAGEGAGDAGVNAGGDAGSAADDAGADVSKDAGAAGDGADAGALHPDGGTVPGGGMDAGPVEPVVACPNPGDPCPEHFTCREG